jgi:hypothetical protein
MCVEGDGMKEIAADHPGTRLTEAAGRVLILLGAFVSFVLSVSLWFTGSHEQGIFVGLWVPSILALAGLTRERSR